MSLPNFFTSLRICSPIYFIAVIVLVKDKYEEAFLIFILFIILSITDFLDGFFARRLNKKSLFGKIFDPISDKILLSCALIYLCSINKLVLIPSFLILSREFFISGLREYLLETKGKNVSVSYISKIKTTFQFLSISALLLYNYENYFFSYDYQFLAIIILWVATVLTLYTGFIYYNNVFSKSKAKDKI